MGLGSSRRWTEPVSARVTAAAAAGGVIGATARWAVGTVGAHAPGTWPWATLIVNVAGCLLIGVAATRLARSTLGWAFAVTGVLGGFTTFSALAIELNDFADADRTALAFAYGGSTLAAGMLALLVATHAARSDARR